MVQAMVLLVATGASGMAAGSERFSTVLTFPTASHAERTGPAYRRSGHTYRFRLIPERDVAGNVVVVELALEPADAPRASKENLLDPSGRLHGLQAWTFAASDLAHGPAKSAYGPVRTVNLLELGMVVKIDVERARVARTDATPAFPADYRFTDLAVRVDAASTR